MPLYFAYGLLLDLRAFQNLAGNAPARPVAPAKLPAYKLGHRAGLSKSPTLDRYSPPGQVAGEIAAALMATRGHLLAR
jgi:hypothetical protein